MDIKKLASLEELEALKNLIHYENSGEHKSQDAREKILVDFTKPKGKIKNISENPEETGLVVCLGKDISGKLPETETEIAELVKEFESTVKVYKEKGAKYFEVMGSPDKAGIPCRRYFEIYALCAVSLKQTFPDIKVGAGGFSDCVSDYVHEFMNYLENDKRVPLDFFSWHKSAAKAEQVQNYTYAARTLLDKYGFGETENIITAWSYSGSQSTSSRGEFEMKDASFAAATLISLQKTPADAAVYGRENFGDNPKCRLAFDAFTAISSLGIEVTTDSAADHVYVIAAKNDDKGAFMLANFNPYEKAEHEIVLDIKGAFGKKCEIYLIDEMHNLELVYEGNIPESYKIMPETVLLVKLV